MLTLSAFVRPDVNETNDHLNKLGKDLHVAITKSPLTAGAQAAFDQAIKAK